jgi:ribonuclease HI
LFKQPGEQIAILKALKALPSLSGYNRKTVAVYTDSSVTLASLRNSFIHSSLIESIRNKTRILKSKNWSINFGWVKAHAGIEGNELAEKLAKEAAEKDGDLRIV